MKLIKLDAIDSTNSFLKELERGNAQENYTTVVTNHQTSGRGQVHTIWHSEPYKNLTFSTLIHLNNLKTSHKAYLSFAISLAVFDVLIMYNIPEVKIKWPNDILSVHQKICGILIESTISKDRIINSIAGIGLNVNQEHFAEEFAATSMICHLKKKTNLEVLLEQIVTAIKKYIRYIEAQKFNELKALYLKNTYKINIPAAFLDQDQQIFMGIIRDVTDDGKLVIELEDTSLKAFDLKEVTMARV